MGFSEKNIRAISVALKASSIVAVSLGILGLVIAGYFENKLRASPDTPDILHGNTERLEYKGETRFMSAIDAKIYTIAVRTAFAGIGAGVFIGLVYYSVFHRWPRK